MEVSIYGSYREGLERYAERLAEQIGSQIREHEHIVWRLKSEESMQEKCRRKGLPLTAESAFREVHDAIGIRIVCRFVDDVWEAAEQIRQLSGFSIIAEKDYINTAKSNGYRSLHMILRFTPEDPELPECFHAELQLRTLAMDSWAALEHEMKYKKDIRHHELIAAELKRCADELAACDVSMQTIRNLIREGNSQE